MTVLHPGLRVQITRPGIYVEHVGKIVILESSGLCEDEEGETGYRVWHVSPRLRCPEGYEILWDDSTFTPLDGDVSSLPREEPALL